jgi:hypothetical protein
MISDAELDARLVRNLDAVLGEIAAPPRSRLERLLLRLRVPEPTARLIAATPALRRSWVVAVAVAIGFAAAAGDASWSADSRLAVVLAVAPLVPLLGVALAYGAVADPAHEVAVAAPLSGLRLVLIRTTAVVVAAALVTGLAVVLGPGSGWLRIAWLLPALATTTAALALGVRVGMHTGAVVVAGLWLAVVLVVAQIADDATAPFGPVGQLVAAGVLLVGSAVVVRDRRRLDRWVAR